jgi:hypothetical protein
MAMVACGGSTATASATSWAGAHPDPSSVHFAAAEGLCSITVRYPQDAPGEIDVAGAQYIQRDRATATPPTLGKEIGRSGDWTLYQQDAHTLNLVTPSGTFIYRDGANCGSNSAAPT